MGRTLKSASSHLPLISEESDEIQETYLISVVCQRKNEESKITPFVGGEVGHIRNPAFPPLYFVQDLGGPQHSLGMVDL